MHALRVVHGMLLSVSHAVEIQQGAHSTADVGDIEAAVRTYLSELDSVESECYLSGWQSAAFLAQHVDRIYIAETCR